MFSVILRTLCKLDEKIDRYHKDLAHRIDMISAMESSAIQTKLKPILVSSMEEYTDFENRLQTPSYRENVVSHCVKYPCYCFAVLCLKFLG